ncbi:hypothetical protein [Deinococcus sp. UYEF24]
MTDTEAELDTGPTIQSHTQKPGWLQRLQLHFKRTQAAPPPQLDLLAGQAAPDQIGERRRGDRRKKDGLGLLPLATTPEERENRTLLNRLIGGILAGLGSFVVGGGVGLLGPQYKWNAAVSVILGVAMLGQGVYLIGKRERRQRGRRKVRAKEKV